MIGLAAMAAVVAAVLLIGPPSRGALHRLHPPSPRARRLTPGVVVAVLVPLALGVLTAALTAAVVPTAVLGVAAAIITATAEWLALCWWRERTARRAAVDIAHGCQVLAGQLRIGLVPSEALRVAAQDCPVLRDGWALHRLGGDVILAWTEAGRRPGHTGLVALARAWQVAQDSGAPMADLLERVSSALTREQRVNGLLASELAGPRATARLLALLPAAGVWLGIGLGGDPAGFLLRHPLGQGCLLLAVALACAGLVWVERISRSGQGSGDRAR